MCLSQFNMAQSFLLVSATIGTAFGEDGTNVQPCSDGSTNCTQCPPDDPKCQTTTQCPPDQPDCQNSYQCPPDHPNCTSYQCPPDQPDCKTNYQCPPDQPDCKTSYQCPPDQPDCQTSYQCPPDQPDCKTSYQCPPDQPDCKTSYQCPPDQPDCHTGTQCPPDQPDCHTGGMQCPPDYPNCQPFSPEMFIKMIEMKIMNLTENDLADEELPSEYPKDYYKKLRRRFPRRDFTCSTVCAKDCFKLSGCFAKDYMYNFSFPFMKSATPEMAGRGVLLMVSGGLDAFDDHVSCADMKKILLMFHTVSVRQQLEVIFRLDVAKIPEMMQGVKQMLLNSSSMIENIRPYIPFLQFLKDTALRGVITKLSPSARHDICKQMKYVDCRTKMMFLKLHSFDACSGSTGMTYNPSARFVRQFLIDRDGDPKFWNDTVWTNNINTHGAQILEDRNMLQSFPNTLFFNLMKSHGGTQVCNEVENHVKKLINEKLTQVLKETRDENQKSLAVQLLQGCGANLKQMEKYASKAQILQTFDSSSAAISVRDKAAMRRILKEEKSDPSTMTTQEIVQYYSLIMNDARMLSQLNATALEGAICQIGNMTTDVNQARKLKRVLEGLDNYKDLSTYTKEKILCLKNLLGTLSPTQVDEIPVTPLGEAISEGALNNVDFNCQVARSVLKKYYSYVQKENGDLDSAQILGLPKSIKVCLRPMDIETISPTQMTIQVIDNLREAFESGKTSAAQATIRKMIQKVKNNGTTLLELAKTSLGKYIPSSWLEQSVDMGQQILQGLQSDQALTIKADCKKARYMYQELSRVIGVPDVNNINWTNEVFIKLKDSNILSGMPLQHLRNISDSQIFEVSEAFLNSECLSGNQKKLILKKYMNVQQVNSSTITTEDIQSMDPEILLNQNEEALSEYGTSHAADVCSVIGRIDVTKVSLDKIMDKAKFCTHCMDLTTITSENVTDCGALMCALPVTSLERFSADVLTQQAVSLAVECQWGHQKRRKIVELAVGKQVINPPHNMTDIDLMTIKTLVADLTPEEIAAIPTESFQLADSIISAFKERETLQKQRKLSGFKNDFSTEEWLKQKEGTVEVFKRIIQVKLAGISTRRKRETSNNTLTCELMTELGTMGLPVISVAAIDSLASNDFTDCLMLLGQVTDWSSEKKVALSNKMKTVFGPVGNWTSENIGTAGTIIQGLNASSIEALNVDINSISTLGQKTGWTKDQERSAFAVFMVKVKGGGQPSSLTATDLTSLGNFMCGMSASEINTITPSAYLDASDAVGSLLNCDYEQLQAFAALAKNSGVYGSNVASWDVATVSSVGIVIGGLSETEISSLTADQIDSIVPNLISYFPAQTLAHFTPTQFGYFSAAQAQSTTAAQRSQLNYNQFVKLETAAGMSWDSERPASSGLSLKPVLEVMVLMIVMNMMRMV